MIELQWCHAEVELIDIPGPEWNSYGCQPIEKPKGNNAFQNSQGNWLVLQYREMENPEEIGYYPPILSDWRDVPIAEE